MRHIRINHRILLIYQNSCWENRDVNVVRKVVNACCLKKKGMSVKLANDNEIQKLNHQWRGIKKPTNVLSFPNISRKKNFCNSFEYLGDVIISYETLKKETSISKVPFSNHLSHLLIHGILHLQGYKHDVWLEENIMKKEEIRILEMLKINTKYLKKNL